MRNEQQGDNRSIAIGASAVDSIIVSGDGNTVVNKKEIYISVDKVKTRELNKTSPYKGLMAFEPDDSDHFFGRAQFLGKLVKELEQTNFVLLLGASGSGKSSVVKAGLVPLLKKERGNKFNSLIFTPNSDPFVSLQSLLNYRYGQSKAKTIEFGTEDTLTQVVDQLKPSESFWLIFIDQFEELFTLSESEENRNHFINGLVKLSQERAADPRVKIVATMRSDFLDRLDPFPANQLADLTQQHRPLITEMYQDELWQAIEQPAAQHGVVFEQGLVEIIIKDVQGQVGYLPLLQYTLNLLWEQESQHNELKEKTLRTQTYFDLGGVRGALQKHVDQIYESFTETQRVAAQRIFLKLVEIGGDESAGTEWKPVRRRAARSEFNDEAEKEVLTQLIDKNLLVSDAESEQSQLALSGATVEIAHEVLLNSWEKLNTWIKENRQAIAVRNRLCDDVRVWIKEGKRDDELWSGAKLEQVNQLRVDTTFNEVVGSLSPDAIDFLDASNSLGKRKMQERIAAGDDRRSALMELLESCTVKLSIPGQEGVSTGFFVAPGKILTCAPEIMKAGEQPIGVGWQDQENPSEATIDRVFQANHLAILKLSSPAEHPCVYLDKTFQINDSLCTYGYSHKLAKDGYGVGNCQKQAGRHVIEFKTHQNLELQSSPLLNWRTLKVCGIVQSTHDRRQTEPDQYDDAIIGKATTTATILATVDDLKKEQRAFHEKDRRWSNLLPPRCKPRTVALASLGITGLVVLARFLQLLQSSELWSYDRFIQLRANPKPSDKVLVIKVDDPDIADQQAEEGKSKVIGSFSNKKLAEVLERVEQLNPAAVGLDIYRDNAPPDQALKKYFEEKKFNLFTVCKTPYGDTEVKPPAYARKEGIGFSDLSEDSDGILRRYNLAYDASQNNQASSKSGCTTNSSLGILLASQYLRTQRHIALESAENNENQPSLANRDRDYCLKFSNDVRFPSFQVSMGGYQSLGKSTNRCQTLINYQRRDLKEYSPTEPTTNAEVVTLNDFLYGNFPTGNYRNRVVLIGSFSHNTIKDYWRTPYPYFPEGGMPGVVVQAQIVNQIINHVLPDSGGRSLIWVLPQWFGIQWGDFLWIWAWSLAGGFSVWWWRSPKGSLTAVAVTGTSSYILCLLIFQLSSGWLPFIPVIVVTPLTGGLVYWLNWRSASRSVVELSKHNS